ncbi:MULTISPECIES: esterase/lipase family protein [unclassified Luteimonas]
MSAPSPVDSIRRVILLHGIWMTRSTMWPLARRLRAQGFAPELLGYRSVTDGTDNAASRLLESLHAGGPAHVVGHSLGGLIALHALQKDPAVTVGRIVCLGSPLCGSGAAAGLARHRFSHVWFGRSKRVLLDGCLAWPEGIEVGMIAGSAPYGLGRFFGGFDGEHDGTVAVEETRSPALADHLVVHASHLGMLLSNEVAAQTAQFLGAGFFDHGKPSP